MSGRQFYAGWYITTDDEEYDPELSPDTHPDTPEAFPKKRRPIDAHADLDHIIDEVERSLYALTSYKADNAFTTWKAGRWNADKETFEYSSNGTPTAGWNETRGLMIWGDIDLADDLKKDRQELDPETRRTAEKALQAYIEGYAQLYGSNEAVFALDSVGGAYIMGAPAATQPIVTYFRDVKQDEDAIGLMFEEFRDRTNERLKQIEGSWIAVQANS